MGSAGGSARRALPGVCAAVALLAALSVILATPSETVFTVDCGSKALQAQRLLDTRYRAFDLGYPARALDPSGRWFPVPPPYAVQREGRFYAQYPVAYAAVAAPFLAALGPVGLRVPAAIGLAACAALMAAWVGPLLGWRWSLVAGVGIALATPLAFYGVTIWEHSLSVALALLAQQLATRPDRAQLLGAGLSIGLGCWLREELLLFGIALAAVLLATRRQPMRLLWLGLGALPALAVLLGSNALSFGNPLGAHVAGNVGAASFPAPAKALRDLGAILAGYGGSASASLALAALVVGSWIAGAAAARSPRRLAAAVPALAAPALLAWSAAALRLAGPGNPVEVLARTNGLLLRMPLVALAGAGLALVLRRGELAPLRFGALVGVGFLLLELPFRVLLTDFLPGFHWAPRMLLPALPALVLLGLVAVREALRNASGWSLRAAQAAALGLALAGVAGSAQAVWLLDAVKRDGLELQRFVIATEPEVVVTDRPALGQQLPALWKRRPLLLVRGAGELPLLAADLERAGVEDFAYLARAVGRAPTRAGNFHCAATGRYRGARIPAVFDVDRLVCERRATSEPGHRDPDRPPPQAPQNWK